MNREDLYGWSTHELADYLVDNEVYEDIETAMLTDRCDLIDEVLETQEDDTE